MDATIARAKYPAEEWRVGWDYTNDLETGDSVASAVVTVYLGSAAQASMVDGSPSITANDDGVDAIVSQKIVGGTAGNSYSVRIVATTTDGDVFERRWQLRVQ